MLRKLLITVFITITSLATAQIDTLTSLIDYPSGALIYDGNYLYGVIAHSDGGGIFKIKPDGTNFSTLPTTFLSGNAVSGALYDDGTYLYGMNEGSSTDYGGIFKIKPDGTNYTTLLNFGLTNGAYPYGSVISDGTYLYGMTNYGGIYLKGVVFRVMPDGSNYNVLLNFNDTNGAKPYGSLVTDGTYLYGTTSEGGGTANVPGPGNIFKIKKDGTGYANLLTFSGVTGTNPSCTLYYDGTDLYGMALPGAQVWDVAANIFKIHTDGSNYTCLKYFDAGIYSYSSLISDGTYLYGLTYNGGSYNKGYIFKIRKDGMGFAKIADFNGANGASPVYTALFLKDIYLYGVTPSGGPNNSGTIFKICASSPILTSNKPILCQGQTTATLTVSGADSYLWNTGDTTSSIVVSPTVTTTYVITGSDTNNCKTVDSIIVTVHPNVQINAPTLLSQTSNSVTICQGQSITVAPDTNSVCVWYLGNNKIYTGATYIPAVNMLGTYIYTVIDSSASTGCTSLSSSSALTITLTVNHTPTSPHALNHNVYYCQGQAYTPLQASGSDSIVWSTSSLINPVVFVGYNYTPGSLPIGTTIYYLIDSSTYGGCVSENIDSVLVTVSNDTIVPYVNFSVVPDWSHIWDLMINYSGNVVNARWDWGDGTDTLAMYPNHTYTSVGMYDICVTAYNACNDSSVFCLNDSLYRYSSNSVFIKVYVRANPTNISQVSNSTTINLYPNPVTNNLNVITNQEQETEIEIVNFLGENIFKSKIKKQILMDVSNLSSGIYFIKTIYGVQKFIKQ